MNTTEVHLVIPALLSKQALNEVERSSALSLKTLSVLLSRARLQRQEPKGYLRETLALMNVSVDSELPAGALSALGLGQVGEYPWWICAYPVLMRAEHNAVRLLGNAHLELRSSEVAHLSSVLQPIFQAEQMRLFTPKSSEWLINMNTEPQLFTTSLCEALGQEMSERLPQGNDKMLWQRLHNDVQMALHTAKVNTERASSGKDSVNGVWFWGAGALPKAGEKVFEGVWATNSIIKGAAILTNSKLHNLPTSIFSCLPHFKAGEKYLIVIDELAHLAAHGLFTKWADAVAELEAVWFAPLKAFLKSGEIQQLFIHTDHGKQFQINRSTLRQWWRCAKPLDVLAKQK